MFPEYTLADSSKGCPGGIVNYKGQPTWESHRMDDLFILIMETMYMPQ